MGNLTVYLQSAFAEYCPKGWTCQQEVQLLTAEFNELFGYSSRTDVMLAKKDGSRRLWIEFEISRADPVANHAKFATAHLFSRQLQTDCFVSMVSSHVVRGRRNLAANTIHVMREAGMNAFQTLLFPELSPGQIKDINHSPLDLIRGRGLSIRSEIERAVSISESIISTQGKRIYFASNLLEVLLNLRRWNCEMLTEAARRIWGKRAFIYFVFDPLTRSFAPSKFCAYVPVSRRPEPHSQRTIVEMTVDLYATLETESTFDGNKAQKHLKNYLALKPFKPNDRPDIMPHFERWLKNYSPCVTVKSKGPVFLIPNDWLI